MSDLLWQPGVEIGRSRMANYRDHLQTAGHGPFADYAALHAWSVADPGRFWLSIWEFTGVHSHQPPVKPLARGGMPGAHWFPGAQLNFAENLLRHALHADASKPALICYAESRPVARWSRAELLAAVAALTAWLREQGIEPGDRVAGVMGNTAEAIIAMLACASVGAIWSSASPDFGQAGILDRFGQIEPRLLLAVNGYRYGGKTHDRRSEMQALRARLPSVEQLVMIDLLPDLPLPADCLSWSEVLAAHRGARPLFTPLPFDHPLYILYSSGTTGAPKCIVHGAGGTLLQHSKELMLHADLGSTDVLFYFTTCGWMMWNWLASGLVTGASLVLFEGNPGYPDLQRLWQLAATERITHFGTSAKFLGSCRNAGLAPGQQHDLSALRVLLSTGSPLLPEDFDWVYQAVKADVLLGSISGGTDIVSCFVGSNPLLPVRRGRIQCRMLGMAVEAFDETGQAVIDQRGELVCTQPAPCMPLGFWNDPQGERYRQAYFSRFPGVWAHGDYVEFAADGSCIIHGRSDATLNPGGVRIGTAEIYRQVETLPAIADSLVVGQDWQGDVRVLLLVVLNPGEVLDEALRQQIRQRIRDNASPRHVPAVIASITAVPYTRSGKKVELAVARLLRGDTVDNREALANPEALDEISQLESLWY